MLSNNLRAQVRRFKPPTYLRRELVLHVARNVGVVEITHEVDQQVTDGVDAPRAVEIVRLHDEFIAAQVNSGVARCKLV